MDHVAIMKKEWRMIPKILSGEKTIESRWYKVRASPWNKINRNDEVFFKNSPGYVTVSARVKKVLQFDHLDKLKFEYITNNYADKISLRPKKYNGYYKSRKYCILIFLSNVKEIIKPFDIDKTGYGSSTAWMVVKNIESIKKKIT